MSATGVVLRQLFRDNPGLLQAQPSATSPTGRTITGSELYTGLRVRPSTPMNTARPTPTSRRRRNQAGAGTEETTPGGRRRNQPRPKTAGRPGMGALRTPLGTSPLG